MIRSDALARAAGRRKSSRLPPMSAMAAIRKRAGRHSRYRPRKRVVEPVLGQIKQAGGFRRFPSRGLDPARCRPVMAA